MREALIVFSIIGLVVACIVFDQYTAEERKVILAKMGVKVPVEDNKQIRQEPRRTVYQQPIPLENPVQADDSEIIVRGKGADYNYLPSNARPVRSRPQNRLAPQNVDAVYHCMKDGKKIISDSPCMNHDANEERRRYYARVEPQEAPFVEVNSQLERDKAALRRMEEDRNKREAAAEKLSQQQARSNEIEQKRKENICNSLYAQKDSIKADQRFRNSDYLTKRHREVDDEIYNQKCGFR